MPGPAGGANSAGGNEEGNFILIGVVVAVLFFGVPIFYALHRGGINELLFLVAQFELLMTAAPLWSHDGSILWGYLLHTPPASVSWVKMHAILDIAGSYFRFLLAPVLIGLSWWFYRRVGWIEKYTRSFNMQSLLQRNANFVSCLIPVARRKKGWISKEPTATGPWRVSESPMLFALRNRIIRDRQDRVIPESHCYQPDGMPRSVPNVPEGGFVYSDKHAKEVFISRMGPQVPAGLRAFRQMPAYYRGLAGAFCAFGLGKREEGQAILDAMSKSFVEEEALAVQDANGVAGHFPLNISTAEAWLARALKPRSDEEGGTEADMARYVQKKIANHQSFLYVWLGALLEAARFNGGVLPAYEFLWLRPSNRELWYFLTSLGGNSVHTEGAAPWAHYRAENVLGKSILYTAAVDEAVKALKKAIDDEGWFELGEVRK